MVTWVLERSSHEHRIDVNQKIIERVEQTGHKWVEINIVPFERSVVGGDPVVGGPVVAYGSTAIRDVVQRNRWAPGIWDVEGVRESHVAAALGGLYMNADLRVVPAAQAAQVALEQGWEYFFVKPDTDDKEFPGTVTDPEKYPFFIEALIANMWDKHDFNVCLSSIKQIGIEWRLPVVAGRVVDYSIYRQWRKVMPSREIYQEVLDVAAEAIRLHNPAPAYVIDIGQVDGELKVIEYNGFNSAGLYACNIANVIDAINQMVEPV
jgi:hypothetical protein